MPELELTRSREDRKLYVLDGVGTLRLRGWTSRTATAEAGGRSWEIERRGIFTSTFEATDASGTPAGAFRGRGDQRVGELSLHGPCRPMGHRGPLLDTDHLAGTQSRRSINRDMMICERVRTTEDSR